MHRLASSVLCSVLASWNGHRTCYVNSNVDSFICHIWINQTEPFFFRWSIRSFLCSVFVVVVLLFLLLHSIDWSIFYSKQRWNGARCWTLWTVFSWARWSSKKNQIIWMWNRCKNWHNSFNAMSACEKRSHFTRVDWVIFVFTHRNKWMINWVEFRRYFRLGAMESPCRCLHAKDVRQVYSTCRPLQYHYNVCIVVAAAAAYFMQCFLSFCCLLTNTK